MARTTVEAVQKLLAHTGYRFTDDQVEQAIADAADNFVTGYDLFFSGVTTGVAANKLIDDAADFRTVKAGAWVLNDDSGAETTVAEDAVSRPQLLLEDDIFTSAGVRYTVEDLARVEMAERYKAASLLVLSASGAAQGISSASLGPMRVAYGNVSGQAVSNEFERKYLEVVGPVAVVS